MENLQARRELTSIERIAKPESAPRFDQRKGASPPPGTSSEATLRSGGLAPVPTDPVADVLPALRTDLQIQPMQVEGTGAPYWLLADNLRNRFYKLGWLEYECLSRWSLSDPTKLLEAINKETTLTVQQQDLTRLVQMLVNNQLLQVSSEQQLQRLVAEKAGKQKFGIQQSFRASMFLRRQLINPDRLLMALTKSLSPLFNHPFLTVILLLLVAVTGVFGAIAHSYEFTGSFASFMTTEGMILFAAVLVMTNILHEVGHGVVATRFGCRVREMGVALIFMMPVAYCDTSDVWRLADRSKRLWVSAGGMLAELTLAILALWCWLILPDGIPRTLAFFTAVTSAATTLAINLNPCLKFDGYYILSDWLGIDNLQQKSFSTMRWRLREKLIGDRQPPPFLLTTRQQRILCTYATVTWLYRLVLYTSIALMVYHFWFKALGIVMLIGVLLTLLLKPIAVEAVEYLKAVGNSGISKTKILQWVVILSCVVIFLVPLPRKIAAPAVLGAKEASRVFSPQAARIETMNVGLGSLVQRGDVLITLADPELQFQESVLRRELELINDSLARQSGWLEQNAHPKISKEHLLSKQAELKQVIEMQRRLSLIAPYEATIVSMPDWLQPGTWVPGNTVLAELASLHLPEIRGYVPSGQSEYLRTGQAKFFMGAGGDSIDIELMSLSDGHIDALADPVLAVDQGGSIATEVASDGELKPLASWHLAVLKPTDSNHRFLHELTGYVLLPAEPRSFALSFFNRIYAVLLRESGF